jgi:hypothetical protein
MAIFVQVFVSAFALAIPQGASSLHGAHSSLQLPHAEVPAVADPKEASEPATLPNTAAEGLTVHLRWSEPRPEVEKRGSIVAQPVVLNKDNGIVAFPELRIQRFGHKCLTCTEDGQLPAVTTTASAIAEPPGFFQIGSGLEREDNNASSNGQVPAASVVAERQVGEVAIQDNVTAPESGFVSAAQTVLPLASARADSLGFGFVAAAQPPPALSEVPPLPFTPDDAPSAPANHIHVTASVATQDTTANTDAGDQASSAANANHVPEPVAAIEAAANSSLEEAAWTNFTIAEEMHRRSRQLEFRAEVSQSAFVPAFAETEESGPGFVFRHRIALVFLPLVACLAFVGGACLVAGFLASVLWQRQLSSPIGAQVEALQICDAAEVERRLPASGGYDCIFSKPLSSCELLRLEARIEGPVAGSAELLSPLTNQACILYSAAVTRQLHDGIPPVPVAFASASVDFVISLKDAPHVLIHLRGEDVSVFDMGHGRSIERRTFGSAPDSWQDFILTHRAAAPGIDWQTSSQLRSDSAVLDFQECALFTGVLATFVGELHRGADGTLSLRPLQNDNISTDTSGASRQRARLTDTTERWRTSWERGGCEVSAHANMQHEAGEESKAQFEKVLASDDTQLLEPYSESIFGSSSVLLRRLQSKCSSLASIYAHRRKTASSEKL